MKNLIYIFFMLLILSCSEKNKDLRSDMEEPTQENKELITLTDEQNKIAQIETSSLEKKILSEQIECTGSIEVPPHKVASVSPYMAGFIKTINYYPGNVVKKGAVLATLQHPNFITLQQNYIEAKSQVDYYQEEFKRQGELTVENAASIKNMQKAKSDYLASEAKYKSLKSQLQLLGVDVNQIEKGDFLTNFKLLAPITGKVSQLQASRGKYVGSEEIIFEIIDASELYLNLNVFEKDIRKIKESQNIQFHLLNDSKKYKSKVSRVGIKVEDEDRTTLVQSIISNEKKELKPGMHVIASILINEKEVHALPTEAIIKSKGKSFVFLHEKGEYKPHEITVGKEERGYTEIRNVEQTLLNAEIVTKGVYYLSSLFEADE